MKRFIQFILIFSIVFGASIDQKTKSMEKMTGFFNMYWDKATGKIWLEISKFDQEFLYVNSLTAGIGSNDVGLDRGQLGNERVVYFHRVGPKILLIQPNYSYRANTSDPNEKQSVTDAFAKSTLWGFKVETEENNRVLIDATDFFLHDAHQVVTRLKGNPRNSQSAGYGVYKSIDAGKTWEYKGLGETRNIHRVLINPKNPDIVYIGAQGSAWGDSENRGIYKTTDGGDTWEKILYIDESTGIGELVMDPQNPNKLIANMWQFRRWPWFFKSGGASSGLYITFDGGNKWKKLSDKDGLPKGDLGRMGLAIARSNPKIIYALIESKKNIFI